MTIIPAIDIIDGKCVRLSQGDFATSKIYNEDPLEVAKKFEDAGLKRLHLVDLEGAKTGKSKNIKVLEKIATKTSLLIDFSGGIQTQDQVEIAFDAGANWITVGSMAVKNPTTVLEWSNLFHADRFIISGDVKEEIIMIKGWTEATDMTVYNLLDKYKSSGIRQFMCTDISCDGMLQGPSVELYKKIIQLKPSMEIIASGGVSTLKDLELLNEAGCSAAIVGKAFYENKISLKDLKEFTC